MLLYQLAKKNRKMYKEWLNRIFTVEQIERKQLSQDDRIGPEPVPFGYYNSFWEELEGQLQEGDEDSGIGNFIKVVHECPKSLKN